jgi:uncharacterized protein YdeI (YjbR/CyaY-like superfamily)
MKNMVDGPEMPLGLGMALAQNREAMDRFAALSPGQQQSFLLKTRAIHSKEEMQALVQTLLG